MQAPVGPLDEPGPELGRRAQRLRCAHKISLKLWFSNRLRPVQCHWCYPSLQIHFSGRATEPHQLPPNPTPPPTHRTEQHGSRWRGILKRWGSGADVYGLKLNRRFDDCLGCSNHLNHPAGNPDRCCNITSVKTQRYLRFLIFKHWFWHINHPEHQISIWYAVLFCCLVPQLIHLSFKTKNMWKCFFPQSPKWRLVQPSVLTPKHSSCSFIHDKESSQ